MAQHVLTALLPHTGRSIRVGITGVPGVGKRTLIESLGLMLTGQEHQVAVLAIDPTSQVSGGSILGDKTQMVDLCRNPNAFIRPSPSSETLGGVARNTREVLARTPTCPALSQPGSNRTRRARCPDTMRCYCRAGSARFRRRTQHWDASADHQGHNEVLCLTATEGDHGGILRLAFNPAVPAQVVIGAVTVVFAIGLVVLMIVTNKVTKGETVVASDEINAVCWQSAVIRVESAATGNATG
jgi:hypothetical protein